MLSLLALRLGIGWQFFQEGAEKFQDDRPYSATFLSQARGPLAPWFHGMVWDADGQARLDLDETLEQWEHYQHQVADHYRFDDEQRVEAERVYNRYNRKISQFFADYRPVIRQYRSEMDRVAEDWRDRSMVEVPSLSQQVRQREREARSEAQPMLEEIDAMWQGYERDLNAVADQDQAARGYYELDRPGRRLLDSITIDRLVKWFDVVVGGLLIVGLFTRLASLLGAGFLAMVIATQPPWVLNAEPTYYQVNLMLALFVLAATGAGRFAGLDAVLTKIREKCCPPKQEGES